MNPHNHYLHLDFQTNMLVFVAARRTSAICSHRFDGNKLILNLGSANHPPARIPSASLEIAVQAGLPSKDVSATEGQGQSRSVKLSQTSLEKG
jgi:hypothetical protein